MGRWSRFALAPIATLALFGGALTPPVVAHHSSAVYDTGKTIVVKGKVTEVKWVNPHAYFILDGKQGSGANQTWEFLLNSPNSMRRTGSTRTSIKVGDSVEVHAYPGRNRVTRAFARWVILPNKTKTLITE